MNWLAGLFLGFGRGLFERVLAPLWKLLWADFRHPIIAVAFLYWCAHSQFVDPRLRQERAAADLALGKAVGAHRQTIADYRLAAEIARRLDEQNLARVKAEQDAITQEIVDDYQSRLAALRRRAAALAAARQLPVDRPPAGTTAAGGPAGAADLPADGAATARAGEAPGQDGLPGPGLSPADALIASEQALQLDALISWVLAQAAVNVSEGKDGQ